MNNGAGESQQQQPARVQTRSEMAAISDILQEAEVLPPDDAQPETAQQVADEVETPASALEIDGLPSADDKPSEQPAEAPQIRSINDLAKAAGIDITALYDLEINFGSDAEPVKLGAIKDAYQAGIDVDAKEAALTDQREQFQNEALKARKAIQDLIDSSGATESQIQKALLEFDQKKEREQQRLFDVVPELRDDAELRRQTSREIVQLMENYGVTAAEIDNLADHRFYKFAMDAARWKRTLDEANAAGKRVRKQGKGNTSRRRIVKGRSQGEVDGLVTKAKQSGLVEDQVRAVGALLQT